MGILEWLYEDLSEEEIGLVSRGLNNRDFLKRREFEGRVFREQREDRHKRMYRNIYIT